MTIYFLPIVILLALSGCNLFSSDNSDSSTTDNSDSSTSLTINTLNLSAIAFYQGNVVDIASSTTANSDSSTNGNGQNRPFNTGQLIKLDKNGKPDHLLNKDIVIHAFAIGSKADDHVLLMGDFTNQFTNEGQPDTTGSIDVAKCTLLAVDKNEDNQKGYCLDAADAAPFDQTYRGKLSMPDRPIYVYTENSATKYMFISKQPDHIDIKQWDGFETITTLYQSTNAKLVGAKLGSATIGRQGEHYYFFIKDTKGYGQYIYGNDTDGWKVKEYDRYDSVYREFYNMNMVFNMNTEKISDTVSTFDLYKDNSIFASMNYDLLAMNPVNTCRTKSQSDSDKQIEWFDNQRKFLYVAGYGVLCKIDFEPNQIPIYENTNFTNNKQITCGNPCKLNDKLTLHLIGLDKYQDFNFYSDASYLKSLQTIKYGVRYTTETGDIDRVYILGHDGNGDYIRTLDIANDTYDQANIIGQLDFIAVDTMVLNSENILVIKGTAKNGKLTTAYFNPETLETVQEPDVNILIDQRSAL